MKANIRNIDGKWPMVISNAINENNGKAISVSKAK